MTTRNFTAKDTTCQLYLLSLTRIGKEAPAAGRGTAVRSAWGVRLMMEFGVPKVSEASLLPAARMHIP